jgi:predicted PurR-regulated permease PerM
VEKKSGVAGKQSSSETPHGIGVRVMQNDPYSSTGLTRSTLSVLFVVALIFFSGWIVRPFLSATLWATMIVISTWPFLTGLQSKLGGRRGLATAVMVVALLLVLVIPLGLAFGMIAGNIDTIVAKASSLRTLQLPPPPDWVARIPIKGPKLSAEWQRAAEEGPGSLSAQIAPYVSGTVRWFAASIGGVGGMILQFLLTVLISAILYLNGETAAQGVRRFAGRLAGLNGDKAAVLAAATIRAVAMGVIVTAIAQTLIVSVGLMIASINGAGLLAAIVLISCVAQLGPLIVMVPVVAWKFYSGDSVDGSVLLAFALVAQLIDNFLRPLLIKRGADLPLLLIFTGVIGGMVGFGLMGIFVGPVILAVTYVLLREWVEGQQIAEPDVTIPTEATPG